MPCPDDNDLLDFGRGQLAGERAEEIERHIDLCDLCRSLVAEAAGGPVRTPAIGAEAAPDPDEPPEMFPRLGRYVVLDLVSAGGMGVVYSAFDPELDRKVALKVLRPASLGAETLEQAQQRLLREAKAMAQLAHPHVAAVFDVGAFGGQVYVAMELVEGGTLTGWLGERRRDWPEILEAFLQAGRGLAAAHAAGIVHRDFKPDNVLVGGEGRARVTDFGLARPVALELEGAGATAGAAPPGTGSNAVLVGTPAYMSPEQLEGAGATARSDQFSFCVALWEALYGRRPFTGATLEALRESVLRGPAPTAPAGSRVPTWLERALLRGLGRRPEDRFPFMEGLLEALSRTAHGGRRRRRFAAAAVALLVASVAASVQFGRQDARRCEDVDAQLEAVWSSMPWKQPGRREALRAAFLEARVPYAETAFSSTAAALDTAAQAWSAARLAACRDPDEKARALPCLQRRLVDLDALVARLAEADAEVTLRASASAHRFAAQPSCAGAEDPADAPPGLLESLARAEVQLLTGGVEKGHGLAVEALEAAGQAGSPALLARAQLVFASASALRGELVAAERSALAGTLTAEKAGLPRLAARGWGELAFVVGLQKERSAEAERHLQHAFAFLEASGGDWLTEARLLSLSGRLAANQGDPARAASIFENESLLRKKWQAELDPAYAESLADLASARLAEGKATKAASVARAAVQVGTEALGPVHPFVGDALLVLADAKLASGEVHAARGHCEQAGTIFGRNEHERWRAARALLCEAKALEKLDRKGEARARLAQARSVVEAFPGRAVDVEAELARALEDVAAADHVRVEGR